MTTPPLPPPRRTETPSPPTSPSTPPPTSPPTGASPPAPQAPPHPEAPAAAGTSAAPREAGSGEARLPAAPCLPIRPNRDYSTLRDQAVALRREGLSRRQIRDRLSVHNNDLLNGLLRGEPAPEWTARPNAKDAARQQARALREQGKTYDQIQMELGVSKSSISLWVRDIPAPSRKRTTAEASAIARRGWEATLDRRARERESATATARADIGDLSERELFLVGVGLYWSEGSKSKPYRLDERVTFVNSDPGMIQVFLAWLRLLRVEPERLRFHVMVHESADVAAIERFWADLVCVPFETFGKTALKKHNPKTVRKNTGEHYRGCLTVTVRQGADLYRRIEGWWYGIVGGVRHPQ